MGKDHKKSRREERDHGSKERDTFEEKELYKESEKDRRVSSRDRREYSVENEKDKHKDKVRDKDYDQRDRYRDKEREREKDYKDRGRDKDRERDRETEKEHNDRGRERKDKEKERERPKDREREKHKDREREKEKDKDHDKSEREKEKEKDKDREKSERDKGKGKEREREREKDKSNGKSRDGGHEKLRDDGKDERGDRDHGRDSATVEEKQINDVGSGGPKPSTSELEQRILKMREERLKEKSEVSEVLSWVSKSRKLEDKMHAEKKKALRLSRVFEEQDNNVLGESEDQKPAKHNTKDLAGMKILHGLDKVVEGGAVILTLKDQNILADGDINDEVDMLENVEIGEQKQRDDAYKAGKKKTGTYDDKFNDEFGGEKKLLPQYDEPEDEGVTLDESGRFTGEAEKKLEELRKRLQGDSTKSGFADLTSSIKISSDYYTQDEMLQFKKPKKKKSLRKKDKLDLDALEAEAKSAGLGMEDLGSRKDGKRQIAKEEQQRSEAQMRSNAYQSAYNKAEEASKALRQNLPSTTRVEEDEDPVFGDEDEDYYKSLEKARRLARKQHDTTPSGPQAVASLALSSKQQSEETQTPASGEAQENKVVFTEMEEFVWGLQLNEDTHKPEGEDMYMDEDEVVKSPDQETKVEPAKGWTEVSDDTSMGENHPENEEKKHDSDEALVDKVVGKGLGGALGLLQKRGDLKETVEWGGRNMDKKKSKLVGIHENEGPKEINIERLDEFGRVMTPKEAFRLISHKFHGKGPGKGKLEKRMKQYEEEMKLKQMKNSDTPSHSVERMRDTQARNKLPYIVLTGNVKSGQSSDPSSGFDTIGDLPGGLTPMLGDRKVEHFLGIKRKGDAGSMGPPKRQRPN
ncbi:hypothetical protein ACHQM5_021832 [Ranunculus cassubicifolius]